MKLYVDKLGRTVFVQASAPFEIDALGNYTFLFAASLSTAVTVAQEQVRQDQAVNVSMREAVAAVQEQVRQEQAVSAAMQEAVAAAQEQARQEQAIAASITQAITAAQEQVRQEQAVAVSVADALTVTVAQEQAGQEQTIQAGPYVPLGAALRIVGAHVSTGGGGGGRVRGRVPGPRAGAESLPAVEAEGIQAAGSCRGPLGSAARQETVQGVPLRRQVMPKNSKVHRLYEELLRAGKSKSSAARIAQSQTGQALASGRPPKSRGGKRHH